MIRVCPTGHQQAPHPFALSHLDRLSTLSATYNSKQWRIRQPHSIPNRMSTELSYGACFLPEAGTTLSRTIMLLSA